MESGFFYPFETPKQVTAAERRQDGLVHDLKRLGDVEPDDRASLIHLNSTYLDMVDRWFTIRGGMSSILALIITVMMVVGCLSTVLFAMIPSTTSLK